MRPRGLRHAPRRVRSRRSAIAVREGVHRRPRQPAPSLPPWHWSSPTGAPRPPIRRATPSRPSAAPPRSAPTGSSSTCGRTADGALAVHHDAELPDGRAIAELAAADLPGVGPAARRGPRRLRRPGRERRDQGRLPGRTSTTSASWPPRWPSLRRPGSPRRGSWSRRSTWELVDRVRALAPELRHRPARLRPRARAPTRWPRPSPAATGASTRGTRSSTRPSWRGPTPPGVEVNVWTVDDPERIAALVALGVDAVITNVPDVARRGRSTGRLRG